MKKGVTHLLHVNKIMYFERKLFKILGSLYKLYHLFVSFSEWEKALEGSRKCKFMCTLG